MKNIILVLISSFSFLYSCNEPDLSDPKVPFKAPTELVAEKVSATSIKLSWTDNSKGEEGFRIERWATSTKTVVKASVGPNATVWVDEGLTEDSYLYKVVAYYKQRVSDTVSVYYQHVPVAMPANFTVSALQNSVNLSWNAVSGGIDGYKIERKIGTGTYQLWKTLAANETSTTDTEPAAGLNTYKLYAYAGNASSVGVERALTVLKIPALTSTSPLISYLKISTYYTLTSDGGEPCNTGVCWSKSPNPTIADSKSTWHVKVKSGESFFGNATNLTANTNYYLRAFATNSQGTTYSNEFSGILLAEPQAINLTWTAMSTVNASLPTEVKAYETSSSVNGRNFKAYYVIADMSTGNVELKTILATSTKTPSKHIADATSETVYAMTNGGYFGGTSSYSLVIDRGQKLADNIAILTRGSNSYSVTRGAFGVSQSQIPSVKWAVGNFAYDVPSPNVEGETPQPSLSATFPAPSSTWNAYSAIGGAPVLLKDGKIVFDFTTTLAGKFMTNYELLQSDIFSTTIRPPRTVIGSTGDNKVVLFVCDGRQTHSEGATMLELAQILKGIGCVNALNLDGGGSSAIIAGGTLLNKPSDGSERAVPSVVAFVKKK